MQPARSTIVADPLPDPLVLTPTGLELSEAVQRFRRLATEIGAAAGALDHAGFLAEWHCDPTAPDAAQEAIAKLASLQRELEATATDTLFVMRLELGPPPQPRDDFAVTCGDCGHRFAHSERRCPACSAHHRSAHQVS